MESEARREGCESINNQWHVVKGEWQGEGKGLFMEVKRGGS